MLKVLHDGILKTFLLDELRELSYRREPSVHASCGSRKDGEKNGDKCIRTEIMTETIRSK